MAPKKINRQPVSDQVFEALRQDILDGVYRPGDRLPSEGKLAEDYGVSKSTIKVAVQRLTALGLLDPRRGEAHFVREFDATRYLDQMGDFLLSDQDISNITEYRLYVEMATARLAMLKAKPENFQRMEAIVGEMEEALRGDDVQRFAELDFAFHVEICRATGNEVFVIACNVIGKMLRQHVSMLGKNAFDRIKHQETGSNLHLLLLQAIRNKDIEGCRSCFATMFSVYDKFPAELAANS